MLITETWLNQSIYDSELFTDYYNVIRRDRDFEMVGRSRGGGVLMALKHSILFDVIDTGNFRTMAPMIDLVICRCLLGEVQVFIVLIYVPPAASSDDVEAVTSALEAILINHIFIIVGDFNIPDLCLPLHRQSPKARRFNGFLDVLGARQCNDIKNRNGRILDLLISNSDVDLHVSRCDSPVVPEDAHHPSLDASVSYRPAEYQTRFAPSRGSRYNFRRANYPALYDHFLITIGHS